MGLGAGRHAGLKTIYDHLGLSKGEFEARAASFRAASEYFRTNIGSLREKYPGKYVAVLDSDILADEDPDVLLRRLRDANIDPRLTFMSFVPPTSLDLL